MSMNEIRPHLVSKFYVVAIYIFAQLTFFNHILSSTP